MKFTIAELHKANPDASYKEIKSLMQILNKRLMTKKEPVMRVVPVKNHYRGAKELFSSVYLFNLSDAMDWIKNHYATYRSGGKYEAKRKLYIELLENVERYLSAKAA